MSLPCPVESRPMTIARSRMLRALLLLALGICASGCCSPVAEGSPHLPHLPPELTQEDLDEAEAAGGVEGVNAVLLESYQLDRNAIRALVREGAWAEDAAERQRLLQAPARPTTAPAGSRAPGG